MLRFLFLPAKRNTWGERETGEWMGREDGVRKEVGKGKEKSVCPLGLGPYFGSRPSLSQVSGSSTPPPCRLPCPPSSLCPGAGSRKDTGPDPCPSCSGSACSALSGPGGQAEAPTPGVHALPQVGIEPSPPSGGWGQRVHQLQSTSSPVLSRSPVLGLVRAGRTTHCFLSGERRERPARGQWDCLTLPQDLAGHVRRLGELSFTISLFGL